MPGHISAALKTLRERWRYDSLMETAKAVGADAIALAHHQGDQAETVLLHAARGSDVRGLCAMRARRGNIIRPLLTFTPEQLRAYLQSIGQPWREDETNVCQDYARNRIRHAALPTLEAAYPDARAALARLASSAQRDEDYFSARLGELGLNRPLMLVNGACLPKEKLAGLHPALAGRTLVRLIESAGVPTQSAQVIAKLLDLLPTCGTVNLTDSARAETARLTSPFSDRKKLLRRQCSIRGERPKRRSARCAFDEPGQTRRATACAARRWMKACCKARRLCRGKAATR